MEKSEYIAKCKRKYPYIEYEDLDETYEIAKRELFITLYSTNTNKVNKDTEIPYIFEYCLLDAMKEIIEIGTMRNFTSYQENGWSWTRPDGGLMTYKNIKSMVGML